jgi:hypothetical protein
MAEIAGHAPALALLTGGLTAGNELLFAPAAGTWKGFNWRIVPATAGFALLLGGLEKISPRLATGIGITALVTVLFTRVGNAPAPIENIDKLLGYTNTGAIAKKQESLASVIGG